MLHKLKAIEIEQKLYLLLNTHGSWFHNSLFNVVCFLFIQGHFLAIKLSSSNTKKKNGFFLYYLKKESYHEKFKSTTQKKNPLHNVKLKTHTHCFTHLFHKIFLPIQNEVVRHPSNLHNKNNFTQKNDDAETSKRKKVLWCHVGNDLGHHKDLAGTPTWVWPWQLSRPCCEPCHGGLLAIAKTSLIFLPRSDLNNRQDYLTSPLWKDFGHCSLATQARRYFGHHWDLCCNSGRERSRPSQKSPYKVAWECPQHWPKLPSELVKRDFSHYQDLLCSSGWESFRPSSKPPRQDFLGTSSTSLRHPCELCME